MNDNQPIHILHILHRFTRGGLETRIMELYRKIDLDKYQFDFYIESGEKGLYDDEVLDLGGKIYYSKKKNIYNIPNFNEFYMFLSSRKTYNIIYAYNQWAGFYLKKAKKTGVEYRIASSRTSLQKHTITNFIKNIVKTNTKKYATHYFAVSELAAQWLYGNKEILKGNVSIWPNSINTEMFAFSKETRKEIREELGLRNEFTVLNVGNFVFEKNHSFLFEVFCEIKKRRRDAKLVLVGNGDIQQFIEQIQKLKIEDSVLHLGTRNDVYKILQGADVYVCPSFYEGFPGAVLEAEASGLPCVISDSITDEVMLTKHIKKISLNETSKTWADITDELFRNSLESLNIRENAWQVIKEAGYDIYALVDKSQMFWDSLVFK